jgi:hypothetical protein
MSERRITRRRGEAIHITGPATIRVNRRVTLTIDAPHESRVDRLDAPEPSHVSWPGSPSKSLMPDGQGSHSGDKRSRKAVPNFPDVTPKHG